MERLMDFLLDSAARNSLRSPSGSTGNAPAGRLSGPQPFHTLAFGWKSLRDSHIAPSPEEQQQFIEIGYGRAALAAYSAGLTRVLLTNQGGQKL